MILSLGVGNFGGWFPLPFLCVTMERLVNNKISQSNRSFLPRLGAKRVLGARYSAFPRNNRDFSHFLLFSHYFPFELCIMRKTGWSVLNSSEFSHDRSEKQRWDQNDAHLRVSLMNKRKFGGWLTRFSHDSVRDLGYLGFKTCCQRIFSSMAQKKE